MKRWFRPLTMAMLSGGLMLVLNIAYHGTIGPQGLSAVLLECLVFSIPFAVWGLLPQTDSCETELSQNDVPSHFVVQPTAGWRIAAAVFGLSMTAIFCWTLAGLFGGRPGGTVVFYWSMLALSIFFMISSLSFLRFRLSVGPDTIRIRRLFANIEVAKEQIVRFERAHHLWDLSPLVTGKPYLLKWLDARKKPHALVVGLDGTALENSGLFLEVLTNRSECTKRPQAQHHNAI